MKQLFVLLFPWSLFFTAANAQSAPAPAWDWAISTPEKERMFADRLESFWKELQQRQSKAFLVIRHDKIVFERYAADHNAQKPHYTASLAKAVAGGGSVSLALTDGLLSLDDPVSR